MRLGTPHETWFIQTLAYRAPLVAEWMLEPLRMTRKSIRWLVDEQFVDVYQLPVITPLNISGPVFRWSPGEPLPADGGEISQQLQQRWSERIPQVTKVYTSTPFGAQILGSTAGHLPPPQHWDHDLLLGEVFCWYVQHMPEEADHFVGEHQLPKAGHGIPDPDAFISNDAGRMVKVVESGGHYGPEAVEKVLLYAAQRSLRVEIW